jgi:hypothetical protein
MDLRGKKDNERLVQKSRHSCSAFGARLLRATPIELARSYRAKQLVSRDGRRLYYLREWAPGVVGYHARLLSSIE